MKHPKLLYGFACVLVFLTVTYLELFFVSKIGLMFSISYWAEQLIMLALMIFVNPILTFLITEWGFKSHLLKEF